ncbi:hypothetical protein B296_00029094, partial [Ensete ventricosum]
QVSAGGIRFRIHRIDPRRRRFRFLSSDSSRSAGAMPGAGSAAASRSWLLLVLLLLSAFAAPVAGLGSAKKVYMREKVRKM